MELRFSDRKPVAQLPVLIKAIKRIPVPDFDPNWIPPGALEKLRKEQQKKPPKDDRPQLPLYDELPDPPPAKKDPQQERGVIVIDM